MPVDKPVVLYIVALVTFSFAVLSSADNVELLTRARLASFARPTTVVIQRPNAVSGSPKVSALVLTSSHTGGASERPTVPDEKQDVGKEVHKIANGKFGSSINKLEKVAEKPTTRDSVAQVQKSAVIVKPQLVAEKPLSVSAGDPKIEAKTSQPESGKPASGQSVVKPKKESNQTASPAPACILASKVNHEPKSSASSSRSSNPIINMLEAGSDGIENAARASKAFLKELDEFAPNLMKNFQKPEDEKYGGKRSGELDMEEFVEEVDETVSGWVNKIVEERLSRTQATPTNVLKESLNPQTVTNLFKEINKQIDLLRSGIEGTIYEQIGVAKPTKLIEPKARASEGSADDSEDEGEIESDEEQSSNENDIDEESESYSESSDSSLFSTTASFSITGPSLGRQLSALATGGAPAASNNSVPLSAATRNPFACRVPLRRLSIIQNLIRLLFRAFKFLLRIPRRLFGNTRFPLFG